MTGNSTHENVLLHDTHMCQAKIHLSGAHGSYPKLLTSGSVMSLKSILIFSSIDSFMIAMGRWKDESLKIARGNPGRFEIIHYPASHSKQFRIIFRYVTVLG